MFIKWFESDVVEHVYAKPPEKASKATNDID